MGSRQTTSIRNIDLTDRLHKSSKNALSFACERNHALCIEEALDHAKRVCEKAGERFTDLRKQVFAIVWAEHKPVKAYDLLSELSSIRKGVAPATVYRALDFLQVAGAGAQIRVAQRLLRLFSTRNRTPWAFPNL